MSTSAAPLRSGGPEFRLPRATLADALRVVAHAVSPRTTRQELSGVLLTGDDDGTLVVSAYDFTLSLSVRVPGGAVEPGQLVLDHRELTRLLRAVAAGEKTRDAATTAVTIAGDDPESPTLTAAGFTVPVTASPATDYPPPPTTPPTRLSADRAELSAAFARVAPALAGDPTLPILTGLNLRQSDGWLRLAATDRYRLAVSPVPVIGDTSAALPHDVTVPGNLHKVTGAWTADRVRVGAGPLTPDGDGTDLVSFTCGDLTVVVRTLDGTFPSYPRILPASATGTVTVDRAGLRAQVRRVVALLAARSSRAPAAVTVRPGRVTVAPHFADRPQQVAAPALTADVEGIDAPTRWLFRPSYLLDAIDSFTGPTVTFHVQDNTAKPVLLTDTPAGISEPTAFRHLLMPIPTSG